MHTHQREISNLNQLLKVCRGIILTKAGEHANRLSLKQPSLPKAHEAASEIASTYLCG